MTVPPVFERYAQVIRVVDGDTLHLSVDLGCDVTVAMTVRLAGINAPERGTPAGDAATAFVQQWVSAAGAQPSFRVRTVKDRREKFGRYLADLLGDDSESLCQALLEAGHAVPYDGGKR